MDQWKDHWFGVRPAMVQIITLPLNLSDPSFSPLHNRHNEYLSLWLLWEANEETDAKLL